MRYWLSLNGGKLFKEECLRRNGWLSARRSGENRMQTLSIVITCVMAACGYGIVHDQITARICIEYFTVGHPQIFEQPITSPTVMGFAWGIIATWWVGLLLGIPLAIAARAGERPK